MRLDVLEEIRRQELMDIKVNASELARRMNCNPATVRRYLKGATPKRTRKKRGSKLDKYNGIVIEKVDRYGATAKAVYEFIKIKGYSGSYELVKKFVSNHKKEALKKATIRVETTPGLQGQVDWKESYKLISSSGEVYEVNIFLYVLCYSRYKYIELTIDRKQLTLFKCLNNAFKYSEGIPKEIWFDNMSTVVDRHDTKLGHVKFNNKFFQYSKDFIFTPIACKPYRPQTKGKVEVVAKLMSRLAPYNNEFSSLEDLELIVKQVNESLNNEISQATNRTPIDLWTNEKKYLLPMPNQDIIDFYQKNTHSRKVSTESMINFNGNKYSVPINLIGKVVDIKINDNEIYIYYNAKLITSHKLSENKFNYHTDHYKQILKSDVFKHKTDEELDSYIKNNLTMLDNINF